MEVSEYLTANLEMVRSGGHVYMPRKKSERFTVDISAAKKTGAPTLRVEREGTRVTMHSVFDPEKEAKKWVESRELKPGVKMALVYGVGMGYHIEALMEAVPGIEIDVIDATPEIFEAAAGARDLGGILKSESVTLHVSPLDVSLARLHELIEIYSEEPPGEVAFLIHKPSVDVLGEADEFLKYQLELAGLSKALAREGSVLNNQVEKNAEKNREAFDSARQVEALYGFIKGIPAIVAATGPSLDDTINTILNYESFPPLIAVDSALKPLLEAGVKPDFVVSVDPQEAVMLMFDGVDVSDIKLIFVESSYPGIVNMFPKENLIAARRVGIDDKSPGIFYSGTVLTAALDFAVKSGAKPVIIVGADFSFTEDRTHASGFHSQEVIPRYGRTIKVEGMDGETVTTSQIFNLFRNDVDAYCEKKRSVTTIYNATTRGLPLPHAPRLNLAEFLNAFNANPDEE